MIIKPSCENINLYLNAVDKKSKYTFLDGIVDKVYVKYKEILSYIISNVNSITPQYYIGNKKDLDVYGINLMTGSLIKQLKGSNIDKIRYFKLCRDCLNFIKSKFKGLTDGQIILMISSYYIKNTDISEQKLYLRLKNKFIQVQSESKYDNSIIYKTLLDMVILLNTKILRLS